MHGDFVWCMLVWFMVILCGAWWLRMVLWWCHGLMDKTVELKKVKCSFVVLWVEFWNI